MHDCEPWKGKSNVLIPLYPPSDLFLAAKGGHFAALEEPQIFVNHLRVAFAPADDVRAQKLRKHAEDLEKLGIQSANITGSLWSKGLPTGGGIPSHL